MQTRRAVHIAGRWPGQWVRASVRASALAALLTALLTNPAAASSRTDPSADPHPDPYTLALSAAAATAASAAPATLYLEVFVNGAATGPLVPLRQTPDGALLIEPELLRTLGLLAQPPAQRDDGRVDLTRLPGVQTRYNEAAQTLHIQAVDAAMVLRVFDVRARETAAASQPLQTAPPSFGAYLNHTLYATSGGKRAGERWAGLARTQTASGLFEANVYGPLGTLTSSQLLALNRNTTAPRRFRSTRLDTRWAWFDEDRLTTLTAGDFVGSSLPWSRALRLGGVQWRRNFAIRPDLVTMPLLSDLSGSAAVPSTVELYVNNARRFAQDIAPGPFAMTNLPPITGAGTARLVVRDALGRETVSEVPFYASNQLLAQGLADFAVEAGFARRQYGVVSNDYNRRLLASLTARYGLTNAVTLEGVAQGGGRLALAGAGGVVKLGTLGVAGLAGAMSRYNVKPGAKTGTGTGTETGTQLAANVEVQTLGLRFYARHQRTAGNFNDLASVTPPREASGLSAALIEQLRRQQRPPLRMSQFSLSLVNWANPGVNLSYTPITQTNGTRTRLASINLGQNLPGNGWLSVSAVRDLEKRNGRRDTTVFASLSWFLGNRVSASTARSWRNGKPSTTTASVARSDQNTAGSVGWRLNSTHGHGTGLGAAPTRTQAASASYRSRMGRIEAGIEHGETAKTVNGRLQLDGAVVLAGGGVFLANRIDDAFAIVNVGAPGVPVNYENQPAGVTDAHGQLLLPGLRAFGRNQISLDPMQLPADAHIPSLRQIARPRYRSGVVVDFGVALQTRSALLTVRDETGATLPVGAQVQLNGHLSVHLSDAAATIVGYDGLVWLEDVAQENRLVVRQPGQPDCIVTFTAPATMTERLVIPNAVCRRP